MADPVFVDRSGRRRRLFTALGGALGAAVMVGGILLVAGLMGSSPVPLPGFPQSGQGELHGVDPAQPPAPSPTALRAGLPAGSQIVVRPSAAGTSVTVPPAATEPSAAPGNRRTSHPGNPKASRTK